MHTAQGQEYDVKGAFGVWLCLPSFRIYRPEPLAS